MVNMYLLLLFVIIGSGLGENFNRMIGGMSDFIFFLRTSAPQLAFLWNHL
jgi:hypothetical protein